ncbi:hypothetical protein [Terrihalobacillus insolitus]
MESSVELAEPVAVNQAIDAIITQNASFSAGGDIVAKNKHAS